MKNEQTSERTNSWGKGRIEVVVNKNTEPKRINSEG